MGGSDVDRQRRNSGMRIRSTLILLSALALWGCSTDPLAPRSTGEAMWLHSSGTADGDGWLTPPTEAECQVPDPLEGTIPWANDAPPLETYCAAFSVIAGVDTDVRISFLRRSSAKGSTFMLLQIPETARWFDETGAPLPPGQRVRVTVAVHPTLYAIRFGPHGSGFDIGKSATLKLNYSWADLGKQNEQGLTIYYQADEDGSWEEQPTVVDKKGNFVWTHLRHFSNYAVAW